MTEFSIHIGIGPVSCITVNNSEILMVKNTLFKFIIFLLCEFC